MVTKDLHAASVELGQLRARTKQMERELKSIPYLEALTWFKTRFNEAYKIPFARYLMNVYGLTLTEAVALSEYLSKRLPS
jgi:hypothetical protein